MNKQNKKKLRYRDQTDGCQLGEKGEGLKNTNWQ